MLQTLSPHSPRLPPDTVTGKYHVRKLEKILFRLFILNRQKDAGDWGLPSVVPEMGLGTMGGHCCADDPFCVFSEHLSPFCPTQAALTGQVNDSIAHLLGTYDRHLPHALNILNSWHF